MQTRCPNCDSLMNAGDNEYCPECDHSSSDDCECYTCQWGREYLAQDAEMREP